MTAIALGALLGFGVAEIGLRLIRHQPTGPSMFTYDPRTGSLPKPNLRSRFSWPGVWAYNVTHDALGMRVTGIVSRERSSRAGRNLEERLARPPSGATSDRAEA